MASAFRASEVQHETATPYPHHPTGKALQPHGDFDSTSPELAEFMRHSGLTSDNHQYMTYEAMDALMERQNALLGEVLDMLEYARSQAEVQYEKLYLCGSGFMQGQGKTKPEHGQLCVRNDGQPFQRPRLCRIRSINIGAAGSCPG